MAGFKTPDLTERGAAARAAKQAMLDKLRAKPAPDPAEMAEKQAAFAAREAAAREEREAKQRALAEAKAAKIAERERAEEFARIEAERIAAAEEAARAKIKPPKPKPTEEELKAARDARYAARKARRGR